MDSWTHPDWDEFWDGPNHWPPKRVPSFEEYRDVVMKRFNMTQLSAECYIERMCEAGDRQAKRDRIQIRVSDFVICYAVYKTKKEFAEIHRLMNLVTANDDDQPEIVEEEQAVPLKKPESFIEPPPAEVAKLARPPQAGVGLKETANKGRLTKKTTMSFPALRKKSKPPTTPDLSEVDKRDLRRLLSKYREAKDRDNPDDDGDHATALSESNDRFMTFKELLKIRFKGAAIAVAQGKGIGFDDLKPG